MFPHAQRQRPDGLPRLPGWHRVLRLLLVLGAVAFLHGKASAFPAVDEPAPALKGTLLSGQHFDLQSLRGKVVLINYYSSYCGFCAYEIGTIETFYEQWREKGFEVLMLSIDDPGERARSERMLAIYNLPGAMTADLEANEFGRSYPTPTSFVVDKRGVVRSKMWGVKAPHHYRELVLPLLAE